nr:MAG TPA: syndecan-2 protein [Caudoviricetes sp.]
MDFELALDIVQVVLSAALVVMIYRMNKERK